MISHYKSQQWSIRIGTIRSILLERWRRGRGWWKCSWRRSSGWFPNNFSFFLPLHLLAGQIPIVSFAAPLFNIFLPFSSSSAPRSCNKRQSNWISLINCAQHKFTICSSAIWPGISTFLQSGGSLIYWSVFVQKKVIIWGLSTFHYLSRA